MAKIYHDKWFNKIIELVKKEELKKAYNEYQEYIKVYPKDVCSQVFYADLLIRMGNFEYAEEILKNIEIVAKTPYIDIIDKKLITVKLLSCTKRYKEAYELFISDIDLCDYNNSIGTILFLKKMIGIDINDEYPENKYLYNQIINYNDDRAIKHISRYINDEQYNKAMFENDFNIEKTYYKIKEFLPSSIGIHESIIDTVYIFKYDYCGRVYGKMANYIKVIALNDSNNIITMYPYLNTGKNDIVSDITLNEEKNKVKRISQIDKFNNKYGQK